MGYLPNKYSWTFNVVIFSHPGASLNEIWASLGIQLFLQRLSHESVKAYATSSIGIMGSKSLALLDWGSRRFSNKKRERINTCLCCFFPPCWSISGFTQAAVKTTITHNNLRHCCVSFSPFVRQPFSKQLYLPYGVVDMVGNFGKFDKTNVHTNVPVKSKLQHPLPRATPGHLKFWKIFVQISPPRAEKLFKCRHPHVPSEDERGLISLTAAGNRA